MGEELLRQVNSGKVKTVEGLEGEYVCFSTLLFNADFIRLHENEEAYEAKKADLFGHESWKYEKGKPRKVFKIAITRERPEGIPSLELEAMSPSERPRGLQFAALDDVFWVSEVERITSQQHIDIALGVLAGVSRFLGERDMICSFGNLRKDVFECL